MSFSVMKYPSLLETDEDISGSGEGAVMVPRYHDGDGTDPPTDTVSVT